MFHSTSHQMMRELDTGSAYRVQFKTSGGYNMDNLDNNYARESAAHALEEKSLEIRKRQLDDYKNMIDNVKEAHVAHEKAEAAHKELIQAATQQKRTAEDTKKSLDNHLKELENHTSTANNVTNPGKYHSSTTTHPTPSNKNGYYALSGKDAGGRTRVGVLHR